MTIIKAIAVSMFTFVVLFLLIGAGAAGPGEFLLVFGLAVFAGVMYQRKAAATL